MSDEALRRLERRYRATAAPADGAAWVDGLLRHGCLPPDAEVGLVFADDEHTLARPDGGAYEPRCEQPLGARRPVGRGLWFSGPGGRHLVRRGCLAFVKDRPWGDGNVSCRAALFRLEAAYVVGFAEVEEYLVRHETRRWYLSRDGGRTWVEEPAFDPAPLAERAALARVERRAQEGPELT